ncbi:MAG: hypothetical protein WBG54_03020 [Acidobacteriaceae bacterium]
MGKILAIFAVILAIAQAPRPIPRQTANQPHTEGQNQTNSGQKSTNPSKRLSTSAQKPPCQGTENTAKDKDSKPDYPAINITNPASMPESWSWHDKWLWGSNILLVIVGFGTIAILWRQTNHIVTSERAWMVTEPCDAKIPPEIKGKTTGVRHVGFSVRFKNMGKTPAFLLEIRYSGKVLPSKERLPEVPSEYEEREIFKWEGKGMPLLPQDFILKNHVNTWAKEPVLIDRGFDILWIYGYIKYRDAFGENRETWFCHRWVPEIEGWQKSGFISDGPESYNHAT